MLGLRDSCLPFPRGSTLNADGLLTMGDLTHDDYEGKIYEVPDTVHKQGPNTQLIVLKNDTSGAITVARKLMAFSNSDAYDMGRRIGTFPNTTEGGVCIPLDDAYTVGATIADNDLFYGVVYGFCSIATQGTGNFTAHMAVHSSALGLIRDLSSVPAGSFVVGVLVKAASYSANSTAVVGVDIRDLRPYPAAG